MTDIGRIVWGETGDVLIREVAGANLEGGDLVVWEGDGARFLMQVTTLEHGSQADRRTRERVAGELMSGEQARAKFYEEGFPDYLLAHAKPLAVVAGPDGRPARPKNTPPAFGPVRRATSDDLSFLPGPGSGRVLLGAVRSGSKTIPGTGLYMDAVRMFSHHVLVPAATGRGKSNLIKCMLYGLLEGSGVGALVLDAHGEYYRGLSAHPKAKSNLVCYTGSPAGHPGQIQLTINVRAVTPYHFKGLAEFREPQERMMWELWGSHKQEWIIRLFDESQDEDVPELQKITRLVLRQKVRTTLGIRTGGIFSVEGGGESIIREMARHVAEGRVVVLDTSGLGSSVELMVGTMAASRILWEYRQASDRGELGKRPVAMIVMEEVPRLLADGLGDGNTFSVIAREGRKFKVGLTAITQLSSVIPKEIMANLGTKIILGNEMRAERDAIVGSAAQDLTDDHHTIASLDVGEAIVSSVFVPFAIPIKIPLFDDLAGGQAGRPLPKVY